MDAIMIDVAKGNRPREIKVFGFSVGFELGVIMMGNLSWISTYPAYWMFSDELPAVGNPLGGIPDCIIFLIMSFDTPVLRALAMSVIGHAFPHAWAMGRMSAGNSLLNHSGPAFSLMNIGLVRGTLFRMFFTQ